ncbi:MAG: MFS transporter, partial [Granulosicoccus sp.]|nr:MFS transporter [Granulosicoccus sp.]
MNQENLTRTAWRSPLLVILAGCLIAAVGFGARSSLGLFLEPMTVTRGWSRESFGLALALQNLLWGLGLPLAGILADKLGAARVIMAGAVTYAAGLYLMGVVESTTWFYVSAGILSGLGVAFSAFSLALAAMVRVVGPERRTLILGLGTAAGSLGQVMFAPLSQSFIQALGWSATLSVLALIVLSMVPLAFVLPAVKSPVPTDTVELGLRAALTEAFAHRGFLLLTTGFFVCGFHVAFITVHFPAYVRDIGLDPSVGAWSISLIGLFNIVGSFLAGVAGQRFSMKTSLSAIYFTRAVVILSLLLLPKTPLVILCFAASMGILWLSTIPLTTGIIAQVFGVRYMATLFGIVFLSHQLGSFIGVWLGGVLYDSTGSYDGMWWAGILLGLLAAIVHLPINERPLSRLQPSL